MKILVTGGAGFIGSHLVDDLIKRDYEVLIIDNLSNGLRENINPRAKFYQEDLSDYNKIREIFENERPEKVFHLAAQANLRKSVDNPIDDAKENILNSLNLIALSVKFDVKHFIFSSTGGAIYGDTKNIPTDEGEIERPISPYGCAKLAIEKYLNYYHQVYGLKFSSLRYSNVYGPRQNSKSEAGVISIFFDCLFSNKNPVIFFGLQTRDFVYVKDVVRANVMVLNDDESEIYNVSTSKQTDIIEIFSRINKFFNNRFKPEFREKKKGEQIKSCLSYDKIKTNLGWEPLVGLDEGLEQIYMWFLKKEQFYKNYCNKV